MYLVNANTERLEEVEILTVPGLFTTRRVDRAYHSRYRISPCLFL